jgi:glycosyltransferase involved in cell wall biosynthesis
MRVALLTNFVPPYRVSLFQELRKHVSALRIFASTKMAADRQWLPDWADLDVVVQRTLTLQRVWKTERFSYPYEMHIPYDTIPQLRRFKPDVILSGELSARSLQAVIYGRLAHKPVAIWATLADHLEDSRGRARAAFRRRLLRRVDRVIVNGHSGSAYARRMGVPATRIAIIPQTADLSAFTAIPLERDPQTQRTLLVVGALTELKGVDLLLRAIASLNRPVRLIVVGDGPQRAELQNITLPGHAQVEWVGHVDYQTLPDYYARAGLLVFPTHGDEWGLVVNEALAAGLPVIGSEYSQAVQDLVRDGENGWRFRPDSIEEIAVALQRALDTNDEVLASMRNSARATVAQLRPSDIALRFANVLREMHELNSEAAVGRA